MRVRENLSSVVASTSKKSTNFDKKIQVGRVYGVVTTKNTPTKEMFEKAGGFNGIGTIFYLDYEQSKTISGNVSNKFLDECKMANPLYSQFQYYPVLGELVYLEDLPSPASQVGSNSPRKYYLGTINLWNNTQQNSQPASDKDSLGVTFTENPQIRSLLSFEGDHIIQGRQGNGIRFGTTSTSLRDISEWSSVGKNTDPITIITNGFSYDPVGSYHVEKINKDLSSIYLTSYQKIPLQTDKIGVLNNITNPLNVSNYFNPQVILNSDRIVLNSKRDEVMLFAKTNIELNTRNTINLNADERIHLNSDAVFLGTYNSNNPHQPVLLGYNVIKIFQQLQITLTSLGQYLASASSTKEGAPLPNINAAGKELLEDMKSIIELLDNITSKKVFVV
jgi:hypothetical protein